MPQGAPAQSDVTAGPAAGQSASARPAWPEEAQAGGSAGPGVGAVAGSAPTGGQQAAAQLAALLGSPRLSLPADTRTVLAQGGADPRLVSVLAGAVSHHQIVLGAVHTSTEPVHAQSIEIVAVDGQAVGPSNVGARDLVTEIAALEPGQRPNEIGTPWPIQAQGFYSGAQSQNRLELGFVSQGDYQAAQGAEPQGSPAAYAAMPRSAAANPVAPGAGGHPGGFNVATPTSGVPGAAAAGATAPHTGVAAALSYARSMLHKLPEESGENTGPALDKFEASFHFHGAPWCGIFVGHVLESVGLKVPDRIASVAAILEMAQSGEAPFEKGILPVSAIRPGDLVTFGGTEHVALVTAVDGQGIHTIAGNYANNVNENTYSPGEVTGVVRPHYNAWVAPGSPPAVAAVVGASVTPAVSVPGEQPAAPKPHTAVFNAAPARSDGVQRHTVKFLRAVQTGGQPQPEAQNASAPGAAPVPGTPAAAGSPTTAPGGGAASALEAASGPISYPGDSAPKPLIAKWMGDVAQQHGLPRELPVMAALVESSLHNDAGGDRDSVGYFQMRVGIWNNGPYAGYPQNPALQLKWFIDQALAAKQEDPSLAGDPSRYGEWVANVERPAEEYRGRCQLHLDEARQLLSGG
jgi:hypothetical protein